MTTIGFTALDERATLPVRATSGSFGYDLALLEETSWAVGETKIAPCGFTLADRLPYDDEPLAIQVQPRSSLFLKHGLIIPNSPGLIDADYTGPIGVILWRPYNPGYDSLGNLLPNVDYKNRTALVLPAGTRVAQAVFVRVGLPRTEWAESVARPDRAGFGSTGSASLPEWDGGRCTRCGYTVARETYNDFGVASMAQHIKEFHL